MTGEINSTYPDWNSLLLAYGLSEGGHTDGDRLDLELDICLLLPKIFLTVDNSIR
jgi:hypothetical protein